MLRVLVAVIITVGSLNFNAVAAVINPPGGIDLTQPIIDPATHETVKDESKREPDDPKCLKCPPLTLGWMLSEALTVRVCAQNRGDPKPKECTAEEEADETDILKFTSRINKALEIRGSEGKPPLQSIALGSKYIAQLKNLVAFRFKQSPQIVWQVWSMIDPNGTPAPPEFGKD